MKKVIAGVFALSMATSAMAATVGFEFGSTWFRPRMDMNGAQYDWTAQGQTLAINWAMDSDTNIGIYSEALDLNDGTGGSDKWSASAIQFSKGVVKNVVLGIRLGTFYEDYDDESGALTDVFGGVTILSGSGDKVSGTLKAEVAARFADNQWNGGDVWNGYTVGLSAGIAF